MSTLCGPQFQTIVSSGVPIPGPVGPQGIQGLQGQQGLQGTNGAGLVVKGTVPTVHDPLTDLPQTGNHPGDGYIAQDTGHIWTWNGSAWIDGGNFGGPPGPQGIPGPTGSTGPTGPQGVPGSSNPATTSQLGSVIVGSGLAVQANGTLSIPLDATGSGLVVLGDGTLAVNAGLGLIIESDGTLAVDAGTGLSAAGGPLVLQPATASALGGVIAGTGLAVQPNGTLSVPAATTTTLGGVIAGQGLVVQPNGTLSVGAGAGLALSGGNVILTAATTTTLGGVKVGSGLTVQADGTLAATQVWLKNGNATYYNSGNVGINDASPAYPLDVSGQLRVVVPANTQNILLTAGSVIGWLGGESTGGLSLGTSSADPLAFYTGGASRISIAANGTTTVSYPLIASVNAQVMGAMLVGTNAPAHAAGDLSVSRNSTPTWGAVYLGTGGNYLDFDGTQFNLTATTSISGALIVSAYISATGNISASNGNVSASGSVSAGSSLNGVSLNIPSAITTASGMVGIGGTSPTSPLTVNGDIKIVSPGCLIFGDGSRQCTAVAPMTQPANAPHTPTRAPNNTYTNSTGLTIFVTVTLTVAASGTATASVGGTVVAQAGSGSSMQAYLFFAVPNGSTYTVTTTMPITNWVEWY